MKALTAFGASDGAVGAPGLGFALDPDCGLWRPTTDTVALSTGGTERARWSSTGMSVGSAAAATSTLDVAGSSATAVTSITGALTLTAAHSVIFASAAGGAFTVTIPTAVGCTGRRYTIKRVNSGANNVTVTAATNIDGVASVVLTTLHDSLVIVSDGSTWYIEQFHRTVGAWTAPTLTNSWVNFNSGFTPAGYRRIGDQIYLRGLISSGTVGAAAFTLPAGFRPAISELWASIANNALCRMQVNSDGTVVVDAGNAPSNAFVSILGQFSTA